jgi:membrane protease YdiL (CAAX protease family)
MKEYLRALSGRTEFAIVIFGAFGLFLPGNVAALFGGDTASPAHHSAITTAYLQFLIVYELIALACLGGFLTTRGWTLGRIGVTPSVRDSLMGLALLAASYVGSIVVMIVVGNVAPAIVIAASQTKLVEGPLETTAIIAVSLVNGFFEELFVCGYLISAMKEKRGFAMAVNASAILRISYHLYQGTIGVLTIVPIGLIFAYWYARTGRLWPLIVAHAIMDMVGLMARG